MKKVLLLISLLLSPLLYGQERVAEQINWQDFLSRHDLIWEKTPTNYFEAPFVGNGLLGAMLYMPEEGSLRLDVGSTEVVERRQTEARSIVDNGRLPVGFFELACNYQVRKAVGRLDLYNAESRFTLHTDNNYQLQLNMKVLRNADVIVLEYTRSPELNCYWIFRPEASVVPRLPKKGTRYLNPEAQQRVVDGVHLSVQNRDAGGCYVTAWKEVALPQNKTRLIITIQDSYPGNQAIEKAVQLINRHVVEKEMEEQLAAHKKWWNKYYTASFISIPHPRMESLYWGLQYKLGSMMRKGAPLCDLMGPWYKFTIWPGVWFNLNTQMLFSSLHISNQLELTSTLTDYIHANEQNLINSIPEQWRYNAAGLVRCTGKDQIDPVFEWPNAEYPERSNLIYLMYYMWEHYRMNMDDVYLKEQFQPLLKRAVNFLLNVVTTDEKGLIHTPKSHSPEATNDTDTNYDLSSLRWGCQTLLAIDKRLGLKDKQRAEWKHTLKHLIPYSVNETGFMSSAHYEAPLMHRHWCHLFQVYPYALVNYDQPENKDLILRSIQHWGDPTIPNTWTQAIISSMYSYMRDGNSALKHMNLSLNTSNLSKNMTHSEGKSPCGETYGGLCRMLQDMLIQSWGDRIRIFPGVSESWKEAVFHNLLAEGGFVVSAGRKEGVTKWIQIYSKAGEPCLVEHNFKAPFKIKGAKCRKLSDTKVQILLKKGETALLYVGEPDQLAVEPIVVEGGVYNCYGVTN
ncbi:MAG: hypothetical protein RR382_06815 [Tannerellaceae bacterium]